MKELLQTHSLSWAESVRVALLAEGIEAIILDPQAPGYIGFAGRVRVAVMNDSDLPRAREVLQLFESEKAPLTPGWRLQRRVLLLIGAVFVLLTIASLLAAQSPGPRPLRPATDSLPVEFNRIVGMLELRDGTILVSDAGDRRLVVIDFKKQTLQQIGREGRGPGEYTIPTQLYPIGGDSTLMPDVLNGRWLILRGPAIVRTVPPDDPVVSRTRSGFRGTDVRGHVLTTGVNLPNQTRSFGKGDSTALVLVARANGKTDTIARLRVAPTTVKVDVDKDGKVSQMRWFPPIYSVGEEPLILADGWIAVARLEPYRIEWRSPDGKWSRPAPIELAESRMTERERQAYLDRRSRALGKPAIRPSDDNWPATIPPFQSRPLIPLPDGRVLILRTPTADVPGNRYEVIDRSGRRVTIVGLPETERIFAVGTRGAYVVVTDEDGIQRIRRHPWP